jgi:hypothetical protein
MANGGHETIVEGEDDSSVTIRGKEHIYHSPGGEIIKLEYNKQKGGWGYWEKNRWGIKTRIWHQIMDNQAEGLIPQTRSGPSVVSQAPLAQTPDFLRKNRWIK